MQQNHKQRLHTLDALRGFMLVLVMGYHLCYDFVVFYGVSMPWFFAWQGEAARIFMTGSLMLISGLSMVLSRSNAKRGAKTFAVALVLTAATFFAMPQMPIWFGILHFFGAMMLLGTVLLPWMKKLPVWMAWVFLAAFVVLFSVPSGQILGAALPQWLYASQFTFWLGFPHAGFASADYYPLLPWSMLFFAGMTAGVNFKAKGFPSVLYRFECPWLAFIGRHTLIFYLVHQPLFLAVLALVMPKV